MIEHHCESAVRITGNVRLKSNHKVVPGRQGWEQSTGES